MIMIELSDIPERSVPDRTLYLRDITTAEELDARSADALVRAIHVAGGTATPDNLTLSEHDMVVAALYRALYGETIECHVPCDACDRMFETQFDIADWIAALRRGPDVVRTGTNAFETEGGLRFRLPMQADLNALASLPKDAREDALRQRCVLKGDSKDPSLEHAMARAGPLLDDEIDGTCPHCGATQSFAMRLDTYLMSMLTRERPMILREIHHIASHYRWSRAEIMALPRNDRRNYVRLILSDYSRPRVATWQ